MNETKKAVIQWNKVPSVTSGGKPYFYNTVTKDYGARRTIVWDRFCKISVIKGPQTLEHQYGKPYMTCDSVGEAKAYVEAGLAI